MDLFRLEYVTMLPLLQRRTAPAATAEETRLSLAAPAAVSMAGMATDQVISAAVDRAVETATIDADAPREPRDERCRFDPDALAAVIRLCDSAASRDAVFDVVARALRRWIDGLDADRTLAAVTLRARIDAATAQRQVIVENLQGDVGTGRGSRNEQP